MPSALFHYGSKSLLKNVSLKSEDLEIPWNPRFLKKSMKFKIRKNYIKKTGNSCNYKIQEIREIYEIYEIHQIYEIHEIYKIHETNF